MEQSDQTTPAERLHEFAERLRTEHGARGMAVGVVRRDGAVLYEDYLGWRDEERRLPVNGDTVFGLASVTKSFTALAILKMQMDGILSVEDAVRDYVPEFSDENLAATLCLWHLLCHSGGYFPQPRLRVDECAKALGMTDSLDNELIYRKDFANIGVLRVADRLSRQTELIAPPGEQFSYCNDGFGLLSDIVRRHGGYPSFAAYVEREILAPLEMTRSNLSFIRNRLDENASVLYSQRNGVSRADKDFENNAFLLHGGGGMKSTLHDMMKYLAMLLNEGIGRNGARIVDAQSIREMNTPRIRVKPGKQYGYGVELRTCGMNHIVEHGGSLPGVSSHFLYSPEAGVGVVVLCNTSDIPVYPVADRAMELFCGFSFPERTRPAPRPWTEEELDGIPGSYNSGEGDSFAVVRRGNRLYLTMSESEQEVLPGEVWQGVLPKRYSDVYLQPIWDDSGRVFCARYGTRVFPKVR